MSNAPRQSKNERRDAAREKAREQRLRQQRREKRNRLVLQLSIGVVIVAIVAVVAVIIVNSVRPPGPGPKNMANGGITISGADLKALRTGAASAGATPTPEPTTSGKVLIQAWEDFGCPICNDFETTNAAQIQALVKSGAAEIQYFPVAILDNNFSDRTYSTRAANAAAAVANYSPDAYSSFHSLMYKSQPKEQGPGLTDDQLISIVKRSGASSLSKIDAAIRDERFKNWVGDRTDEFVSNGGALSKVKFPATHTGAGTPTILVNGQYFNGQVDDPDSFGSFVTSVGGGISTPPTPTPTPSPTKSK